MAKAAKITEIKGKRDGLDASAFIKREGGAWYHSGDGERWYFTVAANRRSMVEMARSFWRIK